MFRRSTHTRAGHIRGWPRGRPAGRSSRRHPGGRRRRARGCPGVGSCRTSVQLYAITYARMTATEHTVTSPELLGARVRALREAMDLSLRDLAERCGVSAPMLSQVERGETSPTLQVATRIAAGLELRLSQLLRLDEDGAVTVVRKAQRRQGPGGGGGPRYG